MVVYCSGVIDGADKLEAIYDALVEEHCEAVNNGAPNDVCTAIGTALDYIEEALNLWYSYERDALVP